MEQEAVKLETICGGAVEEHFQKELAAVLANIFDPNTDPEAKRKITFDFTFTPTKDRSSAKVEFVCKSKTTPADDVQGTVFLARRGTGFLAVAHDPQQGRLFNPGGKDASTGEKTN